MTIDLPIVSLVECVCARPGIYTLGGTFGEALAYLDGFYRGVNCKGSWAPDDARAWDAMSCWVRSEHGPGCLQKLREGAANDQEALDRLAKLYAEHRSRTPSTRTS